MSKFLNLALSLFIILSLVLPSILVATSPAEAAPISPITELKITDYRLEDSTLPQPSNPPIFESSNPPPIFQSSNSISEVPIITESPESRVQSPEPGGETQDSRLMTNDSKPVSGKAKDTKKVEKQDSPSRREVTLITGDKVVVSQDAGGKTTGYAIKLADPKNLGQSFSAIKIQDNTYVLPRGINLQRFDRELFNIDRLLRDDYDKEKTLPVLVSLKPSLTVSGASALSTNLQSLSASTKELKSSPTIASRFNLSSLPAAYKDLSTSSSIEKVWLDKKYKIDLAQSVPQISAPDLWSSGITGAGKIIAILDTGIDASHPGLDDLDDNPGTVDPKVVRQVNFAPEDPGPMDLNSHGTHVAGIAAGTGGGNAFPLPTSPTHIWWSGTADYMNAVLDRPVNLTAPGLTSVALTFNTYYNLENTYDFGYVQVALSASGPWTTLSSFTGNSGSFSPRSYSLNPFIGQNIILRFRAYTDFVVYLDGWYLDDIAVTGIFSDNVEAGPGAWTVSILPNPPPQTTSPVNWSILESLPASGNRVWYSGAANYLQNSLQRTFDLTGLASATLTFLTHYNMELNYDYGRVQVATPGITWQDLAPSFTGNSGTAFHRYSYNLNSYAGQSNVTIRFYHTTDFSGFLEGWHIDDISIPQLGFLDDAEGGNTGWTVINANAPSPSWSILSLLSLTPKGVAPGAWLWNVKVLNQWGWGWESAIIQGIDYARLGPDGLPGTGDEAHIISMSLGGGPSDGNDPMSQAVDKAVDNGLVVAIAAGNSGSMGYYTTDAPGAARRPITVGSVDKSDNLSWFSGRGPTLDVRVKPDVLAPGDSINSTIPGGGYGSKSGTSMATPHVAGAAALLLQASGSILPIPTGWSNPRYVKNALINTAKDLGLNVYNQGGGRINVASAAYSPILISRSNSGVSPGSNSLGRLSGPVSVGYTIVNRASTAMTLNFAGEIREMVSGVDWSTRAWFTPNPLVVSGFGTAAMSMTVDASGLPADTVFSGKLTATSPEGKVWRAIFGFHTLKMVTLHKMPRDMGGSVQGDPLVIFRDSSPSIFQYGSFDAMGYATAFVASGTYQIFTDGMAAASPDSYVAVIAQNQVISGDTTIHLDEATAVPITLNPNKAGQKLAELYSAVKYSGSFIGATFENLLYYPSATWTFYMSSTTWQSWSAYAYYASSSYNAADPNLVNASEWHRLLFSRAATSGPGITYNVNYSQLAKRNTKYRVANTPDTRASQVDFVFDPIANFNWTFAWDMTAPQTRDEWLSATPAYYQWGDFFSPPWDPVLMQETVWDWLTWYSQQFNPGDGQAATMNFSIGGLPSRPGFTNFSVSTGYWNINGNLIGDRSRNTLWSGINPGGMLPGHIDIFKDGAPDGSFDTGYSYWISRWPPLGPPWPNYKVKVTATSPMLLSTRSETEWQFRTDPSGDMIPPTVNFTANWDRAPTNADSRNRVPAGNITMRLYISDDSPLSAATPPWVKWSVNDGGTWNDAALNLVSPAPIALGEVRSSGVSASAISTSTYEFTLPGIASGAYISLWTKVLDNTGNSIKYKVMRSLFVKSTGPAVPDTTPPPVPGLISPANSSTIATVTPAFSWSAVSDANSNPVLYDFQVANTSDMASPLINKINLAANSYSLLNAEALSLGTWFWRVRARDSAATPNYSAWTSPSWSFNLVSSTQGWSVSIFGLTTLSSSGVDDTFPDKATAAVVAGALAGADPKDETQPPNPPQPPYLDIYFTIADNGELYSVAAMPPAPSITWSPLIVDLVSSLPADNSRTVTLSWTLDNVPPNYRLFLINNGVDGLTPATATVNMRNASSYIYTGSRSQDISFAIQALQNNPPVITVTNPNGGIAAGAIQVTAQASDPDSAPPASDFVASVAFFYASSPYTSWHSIGTGALTSGTSASGLWSASWNTTAVPEGAGYKVRAFAYDTMGAFSLDDSDAAFSIIKRITATATFLRGWNMFAFPLTPDPPDFNSQFGDNMAGPFSVYNYNTPTRQYLTYTQGEGGKGFWIKVSSDSPYDIEGLPVPSADFEIALGRGWNQIGNPFNSSKSYGSLKVKLGAGVPVNMADAIASGWLNSLFYWYNPSTRQYDQGNATTGILNTMIGYWVKANVDGLTLIIPP